MTGGQGAPHADHEAVIAVVGMGVVTPRADDPAALGRLLDGPEHVFGAPDRFAMAHFYSPDAEAQDRSYAPASGFITTFRPHPRLREELEDGAAPNREPTALWLRHALLSALDPVEVHPDDRFFAGFGYTADGSHTLEQALVLAGYRDRLAEATGTPSTDWQHRLARALPPVCGDPGDSLPHRVGLTAISGVLPPETELVMVDTACSSSLYAVDLGIKALLEDSCQIAVCGGSFAHGPRTHVLFSKIQGLSTTGEVRAFDRNATGVLFSDGAGVVVLKHLARARADGDRVLGIIDAVGLSCDGKGKAIYAPSETGQTAAIRRAHHRAGTEPETVRWVIAHATGTPAGDAVEAAALNSAAGSGPRALLTGNKTIVGHTGWTAGVVSLIQGLVGMEQGAVPAQRFVDEPIPEIKAGRYSVPTARTSLGPVPVRVAVSAFGFGGTNAHLLLTQASAATPEHRARPAPYDEDIVVVGWSADLPGRPNRDRVTAWLQGQGPPPTADFADGYPLPDFREVRLPPPALRGTDRTQIMLLLAAGGLDAPVREACARLRETTGVVVGHMGPTRHAAHYALRCHLPELRASLPDFSDAVDRVARQVRTLVPAADDATMPGIMPNIIPARLCAMADYRGLNVLVDTGPDAGLDALRTAERYLRHGDLDLAVVGAVNGNSIPELREVLPAEADRPRLAEGAFVTVLARKSDAARHGLPVLARIRTGTGPSDPESVPRRSRPLAGTSRTYLGADPLLALLSAVVGAEPVRHIASVAPWGTQLVLTTDSPPP
ncbi:beta-ketoacyl synthase N-terminal-like domain-containing protein [Streptomyces gilvosporeus]|uniref:Ketosynthase family 3 (KS3) domain-containing protein n=1 Tax=Streptomyces gilvosporeus TaxID=553510 RepID=A0A1V0TJQ1_9ACTN|nr:beta-ketoacyl synthase N-terminal-like domain-containing protein [Streptomyces gilvosporeus]ARF53149.1 hypothetical protein B1H19_02215 [Streptomyces gilvosporeus]